MISINSYQASELVLDFWDLFNKCISSFGINFRFWGIFNKFISSVGINFGFLDFFQLIYTHIEYLMEHTFFEVQLRIQALMFNDFCEIPVIWQMGYRVDSQDPAKKTFTSGDDALRVSKLYEKLFKEISRECRSE